MMSLLFSLLLFISPIAFIFGEGGATSDTKYHVDLGDPASDYYSKALSYYQKGKYSKALLQLEAARSALAGETNPELEFLLIMTSFQMKDYQDANDRLFLYYNDPPWEENRRDFSSVDFFSSNHRDYYIELSNVYMELSNGGFLTNEVNPSEAGASAGNRISEHLYKSVQQWKIDRYADSIMKEYEKEIQFSQMNRHRSNLNVISFKTQLEKMDVELDVSKVVMFKLVYQTLFVMEVEESYNEDYGSIQKGDHRKLEYKLHFPGHSLISYDLGDLKYEFNLNRPVLEKEAIEVSKEKIGGDLELIEDQIQEEIVMKCRDLNFKLAHDVQSVLKREVLLEGLEMNIYEVIGFRVDPVKFMNGVKVGVLTETH